MGAMLMKWRDNKDNRGSADEVVCERRSGIADDVFVERRLDSSISRLRMQSKEDQSIQLRALSGLASMFDTP